MDWIYLARLSRSQALVNAVMTFGFHKTTGNFWTNWQPVSFSRRNQSAPWSN
jgi:hypothetical protein